MTLDQARHLAAAGNDAAAQRAYLGILLSDPTDLHALNELASLASINGLRTAARTASQQAVRHHPDHPTAHVHLGNLFVEDGDFRTARRHFEAALAADPAHPQAHQGLARVLIERNEPATDHLQRGFAEHAIVRKPHRGQGTPIEMLLLVSARGGNIPTRAWIDDHCHAVTAIYTDFFKPTDALPPRRLIVNAIGDADLCRDALIAAQTIAARSAAPIINSPAHILATGRVGNARRLGAIPGVTAPAIAPGSRAELASPEFDFPCLVRIPGRHSGQHFHLIDSPAALAPTLADLPGDEILIIEYLRTRGADGLFRKYRVMIIDGALHPVHLAISRDWKVHYFTADMAENPAHRAEESAFLDDMARALGPIALRALTEIGKILALDYAGIDFALAPDGSVLLFEANAAMVLNPPDPAPIWTYGRPALQAALQATKNMIVRKATQDARR